MGHRMKNGTSWNLAMLFNSRIWINRLIWIRVWKTGCFYNGIKTGPI